jgi:phosphoribosylglycinamide formyltransferase-1
VRPKLRVGVLVSGGGTNLQALLDACAQADFPAELALVVSNVEGAFALERARKAGVAAEVLSHKGFADRAAFETALVERLKAAGVELVCLAGFMRIVGPTFLQAFPQRVLNIHPALLPAFPGMHGPGQALAHGVKLAGCTVHFVDEGTDTGPIVAQAAVPVLPDDDEAKLAARILEQEHRIYPMAVRLFAEGALEVEGRTVRIQATGGEAARALRNPDRDSI